MSNDFQRIDTDEIRAIMNRVRVISENVKDLSATDVRAMKNTVENSLKGEAAEALLQTLNELSSDITQIAGGLKTAQNALNAYIKEIERADAELSNAFKG